MISTKGNVELKAEDNRKTLGLSWNPRSDSFRFDWEFEERPQRMTKRQLLSEISRLYDPAGWLSPTTLMAKLIFQKVWLNDLGWNDILPNDIQVEWQNLKAELPILKDVTISRWIGTTSEDIQLMGFCDASEKAYSCVVYAVTKDDHSATAVKLLAAKTRVVPTSQKVTMPRLELCGALLLSNLIEKIKNIFHDKNLAVAAWSDSQVVLAWLQGTTKREAYVTNRAEKIKKVIPPQQWNYIKTGSNPADLATRGLTPKKLINKKLWWEGPDILKTFDALKIAEGPKCLFTTNLEMIKQSYSATSQEQRINFIDTLMKKRSSLAHVQRVVAWVIRFITRIRSKASPGTTYLATAEVNKANKHIVKYVQQANFVDEFELLKQDKALSKKSKLYKLNPFVDEEDILRVGGRIANSLLPFNMKHPAILPHRHRLTELIIDQAHLRTLHGGARLSLAIIRQTYWIVGGNRAVKEQLSRCVRCHRYKSNKNHQMMADLPYYRVTPSRPFTHCGIDFTGYVDVKLNKGRGVKTCKGFIVIFICMVTKAVCIELTSDMSTQSFIAAFQRMCGRRGTPQHVYTDCGTNFVGAARVLKEEFESLKQVMPPDFFNELHKLEVQWHFNAPAWPSAGGLWESAVKSMKHHLRRVLGDQKLTYEEFTTLLVKIEACMNSRPLCPLTEDPDEFFNYLTPGHFLTGSATMLLPQPADNNLSTDLRKRWQLTERMWHQYWKGWSSEYLTQLQARSKWQNAQRSLKKDDIVLVKDDNLPPGKWAMGRVIKLHPGRDGHVRVVTLLTKTGVLKRPIVKLSPLPVQTEEGEQSQDL